MTETFRKSGSPHGPDFHRAEAAGLRWLAAARPAGGPRVVEVVEVDDSSITLERLVDGRATAEAASEFGHRLAALHDSGADGWGAPPPGWTGRTYIGNRRQQCRPRDSWGAFYAEQRVLPFVRIASESGVLGGRALRTVEAACERVAAGEMDPPASESPARLHGDLWTGNVLWSRAGSGVVEAVLIDPAAHGGHRETDLAMLQLFGAPHLSEILAGYRRAHPLADGWESRVPLHQLHPLATHAAGHGAGYASALADAAAAVLRL